MTNALDIGPLSWSNDLLFHRRQTLTCDQQDGRVNDNYARLHLTRIRSAAAGESERGLQSMCFHKAKRGIKAGSGGCIAWLDLLGNTLRTDSTKPLDHPSGKIPLNAAKNNTEDSRDNDTGKNGAPIVEMKKKRIQQLNDLTREQINVNARKKEVTEVKIIKRWVCEKDARGKQGDTEQQKTGVRYDKRERQRQARKFPAKNTR